jgi:DNA-binding NtrC family response regulator
LPVASSRSSFLVLSSSFLVHPSHLNLAAERVPAASESPLASVDYSGSLADVTRRVTEAAEREAIARALQEANGDAARAADRLQIGFKALTAKMKQYGLLKQVFQFRIASPRKGV